MTWQDAKDNHFPFQSSALAGQHQKEEGDFLPSFLTQRHRKSQQSTLLHLFLWFIAIFNTVSLSKCAVRVKQPLEKLLLVEHDLFMTWELSADFRCILMKVLGCIS